MITDGGGCIMVGTECSGMEPLPYVLKGLGLKGRFKMAFACEIDSRCRKLIQTTHKRACRPAVLLEDITKRRAKKLPRHDLYVAGFPCQPFSAMGSRRGISDVRGRIIFRIVKAITAKKTRAFILENVRGLVTQHKRTFALILEKLKSINDKAYIVGNQVLNTRDHGLPQNRERVFIVGLLRSALVAPRFRWPPPSTLQTSMRDILDPAPRGFNIVSEEHGFLERCAEGTARRLLDAFRQIEAAGYDRHSDTPVIIVDADGSKVHWMLGVSPCLTRTRAATGFYIASRGRRMTLQEMLRLQGLPSRHILRHQGDVTDRQLGGMIGNAISVNVLERIVGRVLPACGLVRGALSDRWA